MATILEQTIAELRDHASQSYPQECCGVIVDLADGTQRVVRIRNVQDEMHAADPELYPRTARTAYTGHPADLMAALGLADEPGNRLAAFYHSHPDHDAYFSDEDLAQATPFGEPSYPEALQIVVSVDVTGAQAIKAYRWSQDRTLYVEVPLRQA